MFDNHFYNLMAQIVEENKSLWCIKNMYKKDSSDCEKCKTLWDILEGLRKLSIHILSNDNFKKLK